MSEQESFQTTMKNVSRERQIYRIVMSPVLDIMYSLNCK